MNCRRVPRARAVVALSLLATGAALVADVDLSWWTVDAGGDMWSTGGPFELSGTIGQPDAGRAVMTGGPFRLSGGFWPGVLGVGPPGPGDCDGDGRVELDDAAVLAACLTGPEVGIVPACSCADLEGEGDADVRDFALFQRAFTGP